MSNITRGDFGRAASKKRKKRTCLIILCLICVAVVIFMSPLFNVKHISVSGIKQLSEEYVINASGIKSGAHLAGISFSGAEESLNKTAYISDAKVSYRFPSTIEITIDEKMPVVYYAFADGYVGINEDGIVTDIVQTMEKKLPVAKGITLSNYSIGKVPDIEGAKSGQIETLTTVAGTLYDLEMSEIISSIDVSEISNITLKTAQGLTIKCGDTTELSYKFSMLKEVVSRADYNGVVDISTPGQATYEMT